MQHISTTMCGTYDEIDARNIVLMERERDLFIYNPYYTTLNRVFAKMDGQEQN